MYQANQRTNLCPFSNQVLRSISIWCVDATSDDIGLPHSSQIGTIQGRNSCVNLNVIIPVRQTLRASVWLSDRMEPLEIMRELFGSAPSTAETHTRDTMRAGARACHKARLPSIKGYIKRYTCLGVNS